MVAIASVDQPKNVDYYDGDTSTSGRTVRRKTFVPSVDSVSADHVKLTQLALAVYNNGLVRCTGVLSHVGDEAPGVLGNNVTIELRAYAGVAQHPGSLSNAPLIWAATRHIWISRDGQMLIPLVPSSTSQTYLPEDRIELTSCSGSGLAATVVQTFDEKRTGLEPAQPATSINLLDEKYSAQRDAAAGE